MRDIVRWDPFANLETIQDELNQLFGRTFGRLEPLRRGDGGWMPALDVFETESEIVAKVDLPGIDPKDVEVTVEDGMLTVKGSRASESETEDRGYHRIERRYGSFARSIGLPSSADAGKVDATFDRGVLTIRVAKTPASQARRIEIKASA